MNVIKSLFGSIFGAAIGVGIYFAIKQSTGETYVWFPLVIGALTGIVANFLYTKSCGNGTRYVCGALAAIVAGVAVFGVDLIPKLMTEKADYGPLDISQRVASRDKDAGEENEDSGTGETSSGDETAQGDADDSQGTGTETNDSEAGSDTESDSDDAGPDAEGSSDPAESEDGSDDGNRESGERASSRGAPPGAGSGSEPAAAKRFAELIKKSSHESWWDAYLPFIMNGLGILLAYQFARGFGSAPKTEPQK